MPQVSKLDHLVLTVTDVDRTIAFYTRVLGMQAQVFHPADGTMRTALQFGTQKIKATGPILSLYIRDPDGNLIEVSNPA